MADPYERWNAWAPRFIADLIHDFGFTPEQAAGWVGNFAAESDYFRDIVEDGAIAKGWAGGTGFAQWTGARRKTFEAWIKRKGWKADSYEANYSYLLRELKGYEPRSVTGLRSDLVDIVKAAPTIENAAWRVGTYFEKPKDLNASIARRYKAAHEALELYHKNPVPPTAWATDVKEVTVPVTPTPVVPPTPIPGTSEDRAIPWYDSTQLKIALTGIVSTFTALAGAYDNAVPWSRQNWVVLGPLLVAFLSSVIAFFHRIAAEAQPVTGTRKEANKINAERTAQAVVEIAATPAVVQAIAEPPVAPPMTSLPVDQIFHELPQLLQGLFGVAAAIVPYGAQAKELIELSQKLSQRQLGRSGDPTNP
jgi:hypothetical protein